jgi:hypothetical protein
MFRGIAVESLPSPRMSDVGQARVSQPPLVRDAVRRPDPERQFRALVLVLMALLAAYTALTLLPTPSAVVSVARNLFVLPIPIAVWWAFRRAPAGMRRPLFLFGVAALIWTAGTIVWYAEFFAAGASVPEPPGPADGFFLTARLLIIAGIVAAVRSAVSFRIAALDAALIISAGLAVGAAIVGPHVDGNFTASTLVTLNGPILGVVILMLLASAAFGSWEGLPRSFIFLGAGVAALTAGTFIYSYRALLNSYVDDRWAGLPWTVAAVLILVAVSIIILGLDGPVRIARAAIPNRPPGSNAVLFLSLAALAITLGVAAYGHLAGIPIVAGTGIAASISVGIAMALRAREAIRNAEKAYARLDRALAEAERSADELTTANEELRQANIQMRAMQIAAADALNLADERSDGRLRELIQGTGEELAELLEQHLRRHRG